MKRSGRTRMPRTLCFPAQAMNLGSLALQGRCSPALDWTEWIESDELRAQRLEDRKVSARQHRRRVGAESKREPLMAPEESVERRLPERRLDGRLRRHLADQRVFPTCREGAAVDGGWRNNAPPADKGAEAARQIEAGENQVASGGNGRVRRHDDRPKPAGDLDHLSHHRSPLDFVCVEDLLGSLSVEDGGKLPRKIDRILHASVHALSGEGRHEVGGVAG